MDFDRLSWDFRSAVSVRAPILRSSLSSLSDVGGIVEEEEVDLNAGEDAAGLNVGEEAAGLNVSEEAATLSTIDTEAAMAESPRAKVPI